MDIWAPRNPGEISGPEEFQRKLEYFEYIDEYAQLRKYPVSSPLRHNDIIGMDEFERRRRIFEGTNCKPTKKVGAKKQKKTSSSKIIQPTTPAAPTKTLVNSPISASLPKKPYGPVALRTPAGNWYYLTTQAMIEEYYKNIQNQDDFQETVTQQTTSAAPTETVYSPTIVEKPVAVPMIEEYIEDEDDYEETTVYVENFVGKSQKKTTSSRVTQQTTPAAVPNRTYGPVALRTPAGNWYHLTTQTMIAEYYNNI